MVPKGVAFGRLDKLQFLTNDKLSSRDDDNGGGLVKIATKAVGLNFADVFTVHGLCSAANQMRNGENFIPGLEFSGVVMDDCNSGDFKRNDRVLGFTRFGAYSDMVKVPPVFLKQLPDNWSYVEGASFIVQALTAWHGLVEIGRMPPNNPLMEKKPFVVVVHSASGGVGLWASEIAARRGGVVLGIVGNESKFDVFNDRIKKLSPSSQVMLRGEERDFAQRLASKLKEIRSLNNESRSNNFDLSELAQSGNGVDIVMESLGGKYFTASFDSLNSGGCLVTFGSTSYVSPGLGLNFLRLAKRYLTRPKIDPGTLTSRNIRLCGFNLIFLTENTDDLNRQLNQCISCLSGDENTDKLDKVKPPVVGDTFDFRTQAIDALERLKTGKTVGKVVLYNTNNPLHTL